MSDTDKLETIAISAGRRAREHFGSVNTPVYRTSTILQPDVATLRSGTAPVVYGRRGTPTTKSFEEAVSALEGAAATVSVPSGLNAIATAILAVCRAGDHLLMVDSCYGPTRHFCDVVARRYGIETTYYDPLIGAGIAELIRSDTRAVYCESPGSLTFEIQDIPAIAAAAHARDVSVLMDNTWATPFHFPALKRGVDVVIHAATKYICGHADTMMGTVSANAGHADRLARFVGDTGLYASGDDCFLALRGLRTLAVRLKRHEETAAKLARWMAGRPEVSRVLYPVLESDPGHALWKRDYTGACGLFGVVLKPVPEKAVTALIEGMRHFGIGYSWGGFESLIIPADFTRTARPFAAEGPVIRLHAGLEDADDLLADLEAGLARMRAA